MPRARGKLDLDPATVRHARSLARISLNRRWSRQAFAPNTMATMITTIPNGLSTYPVLLNHIDKRYMVIHEHLFKEIRTK